MKLKLPGLYFALFCGLLVWAARVAAQPTASAPPRVVLLLTPGLRPDDLGKPETSGFSSLVMQGASGWMVCRAARTTDKSLLRLDGRDTTTSLLLTLGSGSRALAGPEAIRIGENGLASDALTALKARNAGVDHPVSVGALGDFLHRQGWQSAVLGNADTDVPDRSGLLLAMDSTGRVDFAHMGQETLLTDSTAPYGVRTNMQNLLAEYAKLDSRVALVVFTFGDLMRADRSASRYTPYTARLNRSHALANLSAFTTALREQLNRERTTRPVRLIALAPAPADSITERQDRLAAFLEWGDGVTPGIASSASTRWPFLVLNTDLLPTLVEFYCRPLPPGLTGRPIHNLSASSPVFPARLRAARDAFIRTARLQNTLGGLPTVQLLLALGGGLALAFPRLTFWRRPLAAAIVALPLGMLLLPLTTPASIPAATTLLIVFTLLLAGGVLYFHTSLQTAQTLFYGYCAVLALTILGDLLTGSHLLRQAWMSYSVVEGARFYGIGNEYMGAVIGAACVLLAFREDKNWRVVWGLLFLALLVAMGFPRFGAKVGAIPSAGAAFGIAVLRLWRGKVRGRDILALMGVVGLLLGLFALIDLHRPAGEQSHLALVFSGGGGDNLIGIALRKLQLEGYLLLHSPWSLTLTGCAGGLLWVFFRLPSLPASTRNVYAALLAGALASLFCNDSGVIAAALVLLYGWAWTLFQESTPRSV